MLYLSDQSHLHICLFIGSFGCDSLQWAISQSETAKKYGTRTKIVAWIHSHVRGNTCFFSSLDIHSQYALSLEATGFPGILGQVVEIKEDGTCGSTDYFELTINGHRKVAACSRSQNLSNVQHSSCSDKEMYMSVREKVNESDEKLSVTDARFCCKNCHKIFQTDSSLLRHLAHKRECQTSFQSGFVEDLRRVTHFRKSTLYNMRNREKIRKRQSGYNQRKQVEIRAKQANYNRKNREVIAANLAWRRTTKKANWNIHNRIMAFKHDIMWGPIFVCCCCKRTFELTGVKQLKQKMVDKIVLKHGEDFVEQTLSMDSHCDHEDMLVCHNCYSYISKGRMPGQCSKNNLEFDPVPPEIDCLTKVEEQMIAKTLLFMKIKQLPRSRMDAIVDRVIDVPLEDADVETTVNSLPRLPSESGLVFVKFKRKKSMKNTHQEAWIRPEKIVAAVQKLKQLKNRHYVDMKIKDDYVDRCNQEKEELWLESDSESDEDSNMETAQKAECQHQSKQTIDTDDIEMDPVRRHQVDQASHTCLIEEDMAAMVVENQTTNVIQKKRKKADKQAINIAPGEGKIPTNWLRDVDFDEKAFPKLFPRGRGGLFEERKIPLSKQRYYNQRIFNEDQRCAKDLSYVIMAQQHDERDRLERIINVSGQKGVKSNGSDFFEVKDPCSIFTAIRGSPKYWKNMRNEMLARIEQLGPFQIFWTLSCGELRWPEVSASILQMKGFNITFRIEEKSYWDGKEENILINDQTLPEFLRQCDMDKNNILRDNLVHITRMFDSRVKSFVKNILMGDGKIPVPIAHYAYRIEFQARGKTLIYF